MKIERYKPIRFGELKIPHIEIEDTTYSPLHYHIKLYHQFIKIVNDTDLGKQVKEFISSHPKIQKLIGKQIAQGDQSVAFSIDKFTCWFLWRANQVGPEQAEKDLNDYLDSDTIETIYTLWVLGIDVEETIELFDGITIVPISEIPNFTMYKDKFLQNKHKDIFLGTPTPTCALITTIFNKKSTTSSNRQAKRKKNEDISLLLNLINNTSCLPYLMNINVSEKTPIGPFGGHLATGSTYDVVGNMTTKLSASDFTEIESLFEKFSRFSDNEQSRFSIIINRIRQAKRRNSIEDKILDLVIALEMMLLEDNDKSQLKLQFRLRGSLLISETDNEKTNYFTTFGKLYDYRSSVAHSGMLKDKDRKIIKEKFPKFCNLTEKVCKTLILQGSPKWDDLVLGIKDIKEDGVAL